VYITQVFIFKLIFVLIASADIFSFEINKYRAIISTMIDIEGSRCCTTNTEQFEKIEKSTEFLKVVSDTNRIKILCVLSCKKICVCDLAVELGLAQNLVSHHLKVLEKAGLLEKKRDSNQIFYSIIHKEIEKINYLKKLIGI
jgi:ArsR family transcriptional regulator, arsenate/arsenite/antimonite-responsive transcriptional repressor